MGLHSYDWIDFNKIAFFYRVTSWGTDFLLCTKIWTITGHRIDYSNQGCALAEPSTRKSYFFRANHMPGTLDFTGSELWAPFNFR